MAESLPSCNSISTSTTSTPTPEIVDGLNPTLVTTTYHSYTPSYDSPLYTEINIPLPRIKSPPKSKSKPTTPPTTLSTFLSPISPTKTRPRSSTLSSLSPFRRNSSSTARSSDDTPRHSEDWPRIRRNHVKSKETAMAMNLEHKNKRTRSGTVDALAVVPTVLFLNAGLFTPGKDVKEREAKKDGQVGRWVDGIR